MECVLSFPVEDIWHAQAMNMFGKLPLHIICILLLRTNAQNKQDRGAGPTHYNKLDIPIIPAVLLQTVRIKGKLTGIDLTTTTITCHFMSDMEDMPLINICHVHSFFRMDFMFLVGKVPRQAMMHKGQVET